MKKTKLIHMTVAGIALALLACGRDQSPSQFTAADAGGFMEAYVAALRSGDAPSIRGFWSSRSQERPGFETMHLWVGATIHIDQWREFLDESGLTYGITDAWSEGDHRVIAFRWIPEDQTEAGAETPARAMHYYLVCEDGRWVLGNPIDVLTSGWETYETGHLIFRYPAAVDIEKHLAELEVVEADCVSMLEALDLSLDRKIEFYKASSREECGRLVCFPPANGYAAIQMTNDTSMPQWFNVVVSTTFNNPHEVMHVLTVTAGIPYVSAAFLEGFAVAYGGTSFQAPEFADVHTRNLLDGSDYVPLGRLLAMPDAEFLRASDITYQEAGSFVRFMIAGYGIERMRRFCDEVVVLGDAAPAAEKVYGMSLDGIETLWQRHLQNVPLLDAGTEVSQSAEVVFSMTDPSGDDRGDGDYVYPADKRFTPGVFDLTGFSVSRDLDRVYFRVELANMMEPVRYRPGGGGFAPGVVIAIRKGDAAEGHRHESCHGVGFGPDRGFDLKVAAGFGVCLADNFGKVIQATGDLRDEIVRPEHNTVEFSLPADVIGVPDETWSYFVGVGLVNDRSMNFFGGPMPAMKDHPVFISGAKADHGSPALIDILLPPDVDQARILGDYDPEEEKEAVVPWN